jgi:hypothetical protein
MDQIKLYSILRTDLHLTDDKAADFVSAMGKTAERELISYLININRLFVVVYRYKCENTADRFFTY